MIITPLHRHFSPSHLADVVAAMRIMGPPRIRAYYDATSGAWFALEGTHRLRAALQLGMSPVMVPVRWPRSRTVRRNRARSRVRASRRHAVIRIMAPHFVAGVIVGERAAPIVHYMASWSAARIRSYCASKRWRCEDA